MEWVRRWRMSLFTGWKKAGCSPRSTECLGNRMANINETTAAQLVACYRDGMRLGVGYIRERRTNK